LWRKSTFEAHSFFNEALGGRNQDDMDHAPSSVPETGPGSKDLSVSAESHLAVLFLQYFQYVSFGTFPVIS